MGQLSDTFGRNFYYLRLSVTEVCNFKCVYCLPNGYQKCANQQEPLNIDEIKNLVSAFSAMGFWKVRVTGGEPTVRQDILEIIQAIKSIPGIRQVALSTNGYRLKKLAPFLKEAGLDMLNVSVDSLNTHQFKEITAKSNLAEILEGIDEALKVGFSSIKVNTVLLKKLNFIEFSSYLNWIKDVPISVRFIELMRTGDNAKLFNEQHVSGELIRMELLKNGWVQRERKHGDGPAIEFAHSDYKGRIGLITPYSKDFCNTCNRLRISSQGGLRLCLFGEKDHSLRHFLQGAYQKKALIEEVHHLINRKAQSHYLLEENYGSTRHFAAIGG